MDHQTIVKLILYDYQLQCFSYLAVNFHCVNFIFNIDDEPVKHILCRFMGILKLAKIWLTAIHLQHILCRILDKMIYFE